MPTQLALFTWSPVVTRQRRSEKSRRAAGPLALAGCNLDWRYLRACDTDTFVVRWIAALNIQFALNHVRKLLWTG